MWKSSHGEAREGVKGNNYTFSSNYSSVPWLCMCLWISDIRPLSGAENTRLCSYVSLKMARKSHNIRCRRCDLGPPGVFLSFPLLTNWLRNKRDGVFQVTVAAEGCDYATLILIVISNQQWTVRVLFQQHHGDCLHQMNLMGAICNPGPLLAAGKTRCQFLQGDIRRSHVLQVAFEWYVGSICHLQHLVGCKKIKPTHVNVLNLTDFSADTMMRVCLCFFIFATYWEDLSF